MRITAAVPLVQLRRIPVSMVVSDTATGCAETVELGVVQQ